MGNHRQSEHRREGKKCREPQHLTENSHLPLTVVVHFNEDSCATCAVVPETNVLAMLSHLKACVKLPTALAG